MEQLGKVGAFILAGVFAAVGMIASTHPNFDAIPTPQPPVVAPGLPTQSVVLASADISTPFAERDSFSAEAPPPPPPPPPVNPVFVVPSSPAPIGEAQAYAASLVSGDQFGCLVELWNRESGWRTNAANPSGAYGIPQALPGSKMASAGEDWMTSYVTQINWGLGYINGRYGSPCGAWEFFLNNNWY